MKTLLVGQYIHSSCVNRPYAAPKHSRNLAQDAKDGVVVRAPRCSSHVA